MAQGGNVIRGHCMPDLTDDEVLLTRGVQRKQLPAINTQWDPVHTYRQLVILVAFKGDSTYFNIENPHETYDKMFNENGYNQGNGKGCVADYFRDQSYGLFNMQFDVFGPYEISGKAQPYNNPDAETRNYGRDAMREATQMMIDENPEHDFSVYDWNGNGVVNQVIYIFAGYSGNVDNKKAYGYLWPNTSSFTALTTPTGQQISPYTASAECWLTTSAYRSCGIGTICHEFSHSLGLPDIYPTSGKVGFSMVDEWDLMDGGNFTNYGWCPPSYTSLEKMLLGWLTPIELTDATTITGMRSIEDGGETYMIKHSNKEYYLLENRQWKGWDVGVPGKGLVVFHVDYDESKWSSNKVNNTKGFPRFSMVHADGLDYDGWDEVIDARELSQYIETARMHNRHLSTSPYPWTTDSTDFVNNLLTDKSSPASLMYNENDAGSKYLSKAIRNITMTDDGLISFDFGGYDPTHVRQVTLRSVEPTRVYDLNGRYVGQRIESQSPGLYVVRQSDGTTKKVVKR